MVSANNTNDGTIINCYSNGQVVGDYCAGGLVGESNGGNCESCFWDIETSEQETSAGGTGKITAEMKQEATFTNWDFVNIWDIDEGVVYPFLICFNEISIVALCPVDLIVTDPDGLEISKQLNEIPGATYLEYDLNGDGKLDDIVTVPKKLGDYLTQVVPEPNALSTDTYSLETTIYGQTIVLAENVQIQDIPEDSYEIESRLCYSDLDHSNDVDFIDYAIFASHWFEQDCNYPAWCEGTDLDYSGRVDFNDLAIFTENWLWPNSGGQGDEMGRSSSQPLEQLLDMQPVQQVQPVEVQPIKKINIGEMVSLLEEIWLQDDGLRELVSDDEWNEFINKVKNPQNY